MDGWCMQWCLVLWSSGAKMQWWSVLQAVAHLPPPPVLYLNLAHLHISGGPIKLLQHCARSSYSITGSPIPPRVNYEEQATLQFKWVWVGGGVLTLWCIGDRRGGVLVNRFGGVSVHRLWLWCIGSECAMPSRPRRSSALLSCSARAPFR